MNITLRQVSKSFGETQAIHPLDLHIAAGQFTTLLGPSGCGKTTLLRLIAGLETPTGGEILLGDEYVFSLTKKQFKPVQKRNLGMVFQDFALWPHLTVFENVAFGLRATKQTHQLKERVIEAIQAVQLEGFEQRLPNQLSGGQQQRVAFARAIAVRSGIILFDEPLSALDAMLRDDMRNELTSLVRSLGLTAVYVTHDQTEAMSMSDQVIVMKAGRIMQQGTPEEIYRQPENCYVASFIGKSNWIEQDEVMVRPEHVHFSQTDRQSSSWQAIVLQSIFVGERYEVLLELESGQKWWAYNDKKLDIGERITLYVSPQHIHILNSKEEKKIYETIK